MNLLVARDITKRFGAVTAVDAANLTVAPGEVVGLLGANGAGKTTLIRMALGLLRPSEGEVLLFGEPPGISVRRRIGYVPQGLGLYGDLTIRENLAFVARAFGVRSGGSLSTLGELDQLVGGLSLGLKRQVAFEAAFIHSPQLLILDEPTSGVGLLARTHLWDRIHAAAETGSGVLVTTHHMNEAQECGRVVLMASGRVVASGKVEDLVAGADVVEVHAPSWAEVFNALEQSGLSVALRGRRVRVVDAGVEQVGSILERQGIEAELEIQPATFEETFLSLTRAA